MRPYADHDAYDQLTDELAVIDPWDRDFRRPSDFPSPQQFVLAMTVAPQTRATTASEGESSAPSDASSSTPTSR